MVSPATATVPWVEQKWCLPLNWRSLKAKAGLSLHGWVREGGFANSLHSDGCPPGAKQRPPEGAARVAACGARDPSAGQRKGGRVGREGRDGSLRPWPECVVLVRGRGSAQVPRRSPEAPRVHSGWRTRGPAPAGATSGQRAAQGAWLGKKKLAFFSAVGSPRSPTSLFHPPVSGTAGR